MGGICLKHPPHSTRVIEPVTPEEFRRYYDLRWRILRAPWNQPRGSERDSLDDTGIHLMAIDSKHTVLGVGRLHFNTLREARIRFMGVDTPCQRRGIGSLILRMLEVKAASLGAAIIVLNAREAALGFYRKHGYTMTGTGHMLFNCIAHVRMQKKIFKAPIE